MKIHKFFAVIFLVTVLFISGVANAALVVHWDLLDSTPVVIPDEQIVMHATIYNDLSSDEIFTQSDIYARYFDGGTLLRSSTCGFFSCNDLNPYFYTPNVTNDLSMFEGMILNPGESFDFIFATLVPFDGVAEPGTYTGLPMLSVRDPAADFQQSFIGTSYTVTVSAVPLPAAVWLFGSGLIGLIGLVRLRKDS